jgi:hypothetical protein
MTESPFHKTWTDGQFEEMCWHDNSVYGFSLEAGEYGSGVLTFDLDHILEWQCEPEGSCRFVIAPVTLTFRGVYDLKVTLDYGISQWATHPFSIHEIHRALRTYDRGSTYHWRIEINFPEGSEITFEAKGFEQRSRGEPVHCVDQRLPPEVRAMYPVR